MNTGSILIFLSSIVAVVFAGCFEAEYQAFWAGDQATVLISLEYGEPLGNNECSRPDQGLSGPCYKLNATSITITTVASSRSFSQLEPTGLYGGKTHDVDELFYPPTASASPFPMTGFVLRNGSAALVNMVSISYGQRTILNCIRYVNLTPHRYIF
jgi:hypothetical protein